MSFPSSSQSLHKRYTALISQSFSSTLRKMILSSDFLYKVSFPLYCRLVCNWHYCLDSSLRVDSPFFPWSQRLPFQEHVHALSLSLLLLHRIILNSSDKFFSRTGKGDMLDANVDPLLDVPIADSFVDYHPDCGFGDIVDDAGFAVVNFVRHTVLIIRNFSDTKQEDMLTLFGQLRWP